MKRIISVILVMVMVLALSGCGAPDGFTKNTYKAAKEALSVINSFTSGKMDAAAAVIQLDTLAKSMEAETATITDAAEKANTTEIALILRGVIYTINRANGNVSDLEMNNIQITADILERKLKG